MATFGRCMITLILLYAIAPWDLHGQTKLADSTSLKEGAWAFQFGVGSNFTLTAFQGTTIALKYHFSETGALRVGVTVNGNLTGLTDLANATVNDTGHSAISNNITTHSIGVSMIIQYLWYANPRDVVHFYFGLGPSISYTYNYDERTDNPVSSYQTIYSSGYFWKNLNSTTTDNEWALGARGVAGVEWFPVHWFSLRAEYSEGIQYEWNSTESMLKGSTSSPIGGYVTILDQGSGKGWVISPFGVSFGASVYF